MRSTSSSSSSPSPSSRFTPSPLARARGERRRRTRGRVRTAAPAKPARPSKASQATPWPHVLKAAPTSGASRRKRPQAKAAVLLVRRGDDAERLAPGAVAEPGAAGVRERRRQQELDPGEPFRRERERALRMGAADGASRAGREADELAHCAALDTRRHVRQVAGEPEELQLKREC